MHVLQIDLEYHQKDTEKSQKKEKENHMKVENHKKQLRPDAEAINFTRELWMI